MLSVKVASVALLETEVGVGVVGDALGAHVSPTLVGAAVTGAAVIGAAVTGAAVTGAAVTGAAVGGVVVQHRD